MRKTILDFSGIYREQPSMKEWAEDYLDGTGLRGTDCYCDPETEKELVRQLEKMPAGGIPRWS